MNITKTLLCILFFLFTSKAYAQKQSNTLKNSVDTTAKPKKLRFGCGFGLGFIGGTNINLSPNFTYQITDKLFMGGGIQGSYIALKNIQSTISYGGNCLLQFTPISKLVLSSEFVQLRVSTKSDINKTTKNFWDSALFFGVALNIAKNLSFGGKYNVLYKQENTVYASPFVPFINVGF